MTMVMTSGSSITMTMTSDVNSRDDDRFPDVAPFRANSSSSSSSSSSCQRMDVDQKATHWFVAGPHRRRCGVALGASDPSSITLSSVASSSSSYAFHQLHHHHQQQHEGCYAAGGSSSISSSSEDYRRLSAQSSVTIGARDEGRSNRARPSLLCPTNRRGAGGAGGGGREAAGRMEYAWMKEKKATVTTRRQLTTINNNNLHDDTKTVMHQISAAGLGTNSIYLRYATWLKRHRHTSSLSSSSSYAIVVIDIIKRHRHTSSLLSSLPYAIVVIVIVISHRHTSSTLSSVLRRYRHRHCHVLSFECDLSFCPRSSFMSLAYIHL